jgi:hypothetical protein
MGPLFNPTPSVSRLGVASIHLTFEGKIGVGACMLTFSRKIRGRVRSCAKSLLRILHNLIQAEAIDVGLDLNPNGQVV